MARAGGHERSCSATDMNLPADLNFPEKAPTGWYRTGRVMVWPTGRNVSLMLGPAARSFGRHRQSSGLSMSGLSPPAPASRRLPLYFAAHCAQSAAS